MFLSRTHATYGRQTPPTTAFHHSRWNLVLSIFLLLASADLSLALREKVTLSRGPSTGIITLEIPNLLLTNHRIISQLIYIDLDIDSVLRRSVPLANIHDETILLWYKLHVDRTKAAIKEILTQAEKSIVLQQPHTARPRRVIGAVVMGVMALLTVVGTVVGSSMNAVNSVSIKTVQQKNRELQATIKDIQRSLAIQHDNNQNLVKIIQETIVVTSLQTKRLDHSIKLHEQASLDKHLFYCFVEPILFITNTYLRQLEVNMNNLLRAHIPMYFVDALLVRTALSALHGPELDPKQKIRIAFEAGSAIPMYIDVDRLHVSFLLNIPLVRSEHIYQLKRIVNVGTWEGYTKTKINSPDLVAYQNTSDMYLIPQLQSCQVFKDQNYLCPGNPFAPVKGGFLCGLEDTSSDTTLCDVTVTRATDIITEAVLINNLWLVSTNAPNMTISYTKHGTFVVKPITHSTFTTVVPRDVIIGIGSETLFYVNTEDLVGGMELVNTFKPFSIPHDPDLDFLLDKKQSHSLQLLLEQDSVSISDLQFSSDDSTYLMSMDKWTSWSYVIWTYAITIWVLLITILVFIHNKFVIQIVKVVRQRQQEIQMNIV